MMKRMRKRLGFIWLSTLLIITVVVVAAPTAALGSYAYDLTILNPLGTTTGARDINNSGEVIGTARAPSSSFPYEANNSFVWKDGAYHFLGFLTHQGNCAYGSCYNDNTAYAINSSGQVSGFSLTSTGAEHAYIITPVGSNPNPWFTNGGTSNYTRNSQMQDLQTSMPATTTRSSSQGLNDAGEAVGWYAYTTSTGTGTETVYSSFLYSGGTSHDIGAGLNTPVPRDVNNANQVTGDYKGGSNYLSFAWTDDSPHNNTVNSGEMKSSIGHLGGSVTRAEALNDDGQVVGSSLTSWPSPNHAFIWEDNGTTYGNMTDLGVLDTTWDNAWSYAHDINNSGQVVGSANLPYDPDKSGDVGFIWKDGTMTDLNTLIDPSLGFQVSSAAAINDLGWIVGQGFYSTTDPYGYYIRGFVLKLTGASSAFPMLPDPASPAGSYTYAAQLTAGGAGDGSSASPIYLEAPIVAGMPGYEFIVAPGGSPLGDHLFTSVLVPAQGAGFLSDGDLLDIFYGGSMFSLTVGSQFLLPNVSLFAIGGLDLSGSFPDSLLVGVTFNHASTADVTLTPYSGDYGGGGSEPIPEPATLLLLGSGLVGLGFARRRRGVS